MNDGFSFRAVTRAALVALLATALVACGGASDSSQDTGFVPPVVEFVQVFSDEFDGNTLDTTKWTVVEGDGCPELCGFGNNELQVYSAANVSVTGGVLRIEAREEAGGGFTSGRVNSAGKFDFRYGRVEISARLPSGQGMWPALWMFHSDDSTYGPWPRSGEIDIMEAFNPGVMGNTATKSTLHYGLPGEPFTGTGSFNDNGVPLDAGFNEYAMEWEEDEIRFYVNGVHFQTQTSEEWYAYYPADADGNFNQFGPYRLDTGAGPFDQPFYLLMNLAVGGNPVGPPMGTIFPQALEIDYVRVFECQNANPTTGRGCGTADINVVPLSDNDGGPLQDVETDNPFIERLDLFAEGPELITVVLPTGTASNQLEVDGFTGAGATVISDPMFADPDDPTNTVWRVSIAGDVANVFLSSQDLSGDEFLDTGFDFSGGRVAGPGTDPFGEVAFDMEIVSIDPGARILIKLDSGFPNLGEVEIPAAELAAPGERKSYSVKFEDFLASPGFVDCCGGTGVDLTNVVNPFVFEVVGGDAEVYLDNIYVTNACKVVGGCGADLRSAGLPDLIVFDDAVNFDVWDRGIVSADAGNGFADRTDPQDPTATANWVELAADDPARGNIIEVTFNDTGNFGVWFIGSTGGVDVSAYGAGAVQFDIRVTDYGDAPGMTAKLDCFFPCTSGDQDIGRVGDGEWETVSLSLASLPALDQTNVNTGIVIFPSAPQTGGIVFEVDNVRFVPEVAAPPPTFSELPVTFDDAAVTYTPVDFGGASTVIGADPVDAGNNVAITTKTDGAETFAGTVIADPVFASPIGLTPGETRLSVRVRPPAAGLPVLLKIENADASIVSEVFVNTTVANEWETMVFDFATGNPVFDPAATYERAAIFFDFGAMGSGDVFFWDDVQVGVPAAPPPAMTQVDLPIDFEDPAVDFDFVDFAGTSTQVVVDPDDAGNMVAETTKGPGGEFFAGTVVGATNGLANPIPFTAGEQTISVRVRSPKAGIPVRLKVENNDASANAEVDAMTTVANAWETLTFDLSGSVTNPIDLGADYNKVVIFFEFVPGLPGDGSVYYWDDVQFGVPPVQVALPIDFENPAVEFDFVDFAGTSTQVVVDPDDAGNMAAETTKGPGGEFFAGTVVGATNGLASPIPFTAANQTITVRVRSPKAGIPVRLKVENNDASANSEVDAMTTMTNTWETLSFDLSGSVTNPIDLGADYNKVVIFFEFVPGLPGDGSVYYWDDVQFVE